MPLKSYPKLHCRHLRRRIRHSRPKGPGVHCREKFGPTTEVSDTGSLEKLLPQSPGTTMPPTPKLKAPRGVSCKKLLAVSNNNVCSFAMIRPPIDFDIQNRGYLDDLLKTKIG